MLLKALLYRICSVSITMLVAWIVTGSARVGLAIALINAVIKTLFYMGYEKLWDSRVKHE